MLNNYDLFRPFENAALDSRHDATQHKSTDENQYGAS